MDKYIILPQADGSFGLYENMGKSSPVLIDTFPTVESAQVVRAAYMAAANLLPTAKPSGRGPESEDEASNEWLELVYEGAI